MPLAPKFTSVKWDSGRSYAGGDLTYSPVSGECYSSLISGNLGNNPTIGFTTSLAAQVTQTAVPPEPGQDEQTEIIDAFAYPASRRRAGRAAAHAATGGHGFQANGDGPGRSGNTRGRNLCRAGRGHVYRDRKRPGRCAHRGAGHGRVYCYPYTRRREDSDRDTIRIFNLPTGIRQRREAMSGEANKRVQVQTYIAAVPPVPGLPQITQVTISQGQVKGCTTYTLIFRDPDDAGAGDNFTHATHTASYYAEAGEGITQILNGLAAAINGYTDPWFAGNISVSVNPALGTLQIYSMGGVSTDASMTPGKFYLLGPGAISLRAHGADNARRLQRRTCAKPGRRIKAWPKSRAR